MATTMTKKTVVKSDAETIRVLSIRQPYIDDVFFGGKWAENRSWSTRYRGELWLHSSSLDKSECCEGEQSPTGFMTGHILGKVVLQRCVKRLDLMSAAPADVIKEFIEADESGEFKGDWKRDNEDVEFCKKLLAKIGRDTWRHVGNSEYVWLFSEPQMLSDPIPTGGKLNIWAFETNTSRLMMASGRKKKWSTA